MKRTTFLFGFILIWIGFFLSSCTEDGGPVIGGGNEIETPPSLTIDVEGAVNGELSLNSSDSYMVTVTGTPGTSPLDILRITEDGAIINALRILKDGELISANPKLILGSEKDGFSYELEITSTDFEAMSNVIFSLEDENDLSAEAALSINTVELEPTLTNNSSGIFQAAPNSLIEVKLEAQRGSAPLTFIVIADTEVVEDESRFFYGDLNTPFDENPFSLPESDREGFSTSIFLRTTDRSGVEGYRIFVFDENEKAAFVDITINVGEPTSNIFGVLFNAAGPEGRGGLDLDEGFGTGSQSLLAEIKDEGIDLNQPIMDNWKRQISGVNGSIVRSLIPGMAGLSENYSFMNDYLRSDMIALYEAGIDFTITNSEDEVVSSKVNVGDSFIVRNGENYYLIFIREVNETGDNNMDNYVIDIKF